MIDDAHSNGDGFARLSPRETEVLELASRGMTNNEVAERLHVSVHAVKFHLAAVYRKLGVSNRTEAAVTLLRHDPDAAQPGSTG